ncbi:N2,N2-dimethylguanosine tRNA methyltransferase [Cyanobium sp. PCC 7001]|uniref:N2,N2-dimethylguanosine tRNA methyltransferase n=1 Tax=Cyanobium sp. PCC 7001 TaxID=180281 RepID=UPI00018051EB|nr:N2,N2-dimethylguanosine tRNA methyltransferase [Cyanobium sp. PCC 7001]EDY37855.1 N2,N2-dimethylguanosine tRNA methyltransferase [Cyanobium sp. PCC 7001]
MPDQAPEALTLAPEALVEEGLGRFRPGGGFFRPESRPSRDLGVLLLRSLTASAERRVLDLMAGCGVRSLRYGLEGGATAVWANDADPERLLLLQRNLAALPAAVTVRHSAHQAHRLLADCLLRQERFELVDLDAFGCPTALVPLALEVLAFDGVLYLASTDGRSPTGHDRPAAIRSLGAAARAHPASWELALRLQIGVVARAAWALGRGIQPLFSFSEGRTFRTAIRLRRRPAQREEQQLGLLAHCHGCGEQWSQSLLQLRRWPACACAGGTLAVSGPLWLGPLQDLPLLESMAAAEVAVVAAGGPASLGLAGGRLLRALGRDAGEPARCWSSAEVGRRLGGGPPRLEALLAALHQDGWSAGPSGVMAGSFRSDAPWPRILELAACAAVSPPAPR